MFSTVLRVRIILYLPRAGIRSAEDVETRAVEFQYGRNKSNNLAAYLNTLVLYPQVHLSIPR